MVCMINFWSQFSATLPNQMQQTRNIDKAMERGCATTKVFINSATVLGLSCVKEIEEW